jgi:hypothetical protein
MTQARRDILEMLGAGKITADEADRLMAAIENAPASASAADASAATPRLKKPKYLCVLVQDGHSKHGGGPVNVNVRVPMQLLRAGVRLAGLIPQPAMEKANIAMGVKGVHIDLRNIKPENLDELVDQLSDLTVDLDETDGAKVRVFCE